MDICQGNRRMFLRETGRYLSEKHVDICQRNRWIFVRETGGHLSGEHKDVYLGNRWIFVRETVFFYETLKFYVDIDNEMLKHIFKEIKC